ncbi:hypothetical protein [Actinoplanes sp. NPDC049265]|uniref:hypothetical protein n=1 Tax=Actinoplanes sp. NPDC049265 TaxID=3363902 RepID=UPI0037237828
MPEVNVDYKMVDDVAAKLTSEGTDIVNELRILQTTVTSLLTSQGGLWLQQSSPVMSDQYIQFNTSLSNAIGQISSFAASFQQIVKNLTDLDTGLAKPAPSGG